MEATNELKDEHQGVLLALKVLKVISQRLKEGQKVDLQDLEDLIDFFQVFVDQCHHTKEEEILFPKLESGKGKNIIQTLSFGHQLGRELVKKIQNSLAEYKAGKEFEKENIVKLSESYVNFLSDHIKAEDSVLYPLADQEISPEEQKKVASEFEKVEVEKIGLGKHEEYHHMLDHLQDTYLKD